MLKHSSLDPLAEDVDSDYQCDYKKKGPTLALRDDMRKHDEDKACLLFHLQQNSQLVHYRLLAISKEGSKARVLLLSLFRFHSLGESSHLSDATFQ
jgi:hypothetical protein